MSQLGRCPRLSRCSARENKKPWVKVPLPARVLRNASAHPQDCRKNGNLSTLPASRNRLSSPRTWQTSGPFLAPGRSFGRPNKSLGCPRQYVQDHTVSRIVPSQLYYESPLLVLQIFSGSSRSTWQQLSDAADSGTRCYTQNFSQLWTTCKRRSSK